MLVRNNSITDPDYEPADDDENVITYPTETHETASSSKEAVSQPEEFTPGMSKLA